MTVDKVINNNLVRSYKDGKEVLVMGKGLGFKRQKGDAIDESLIERVYTIEEKEDRSHLESLLKDIPYAYLRVTNEIVNYARNALGKKLSDNIYLTLVDHISFAIERQKQGIQIRNALLWEIKRFYNHEYLIGKEALDIIERRLEIRLSEDEAGFIALHIVNAQLDNSGMQQTMEMTKMIQNIMNIVKYYFRVELDESSLDYERFLTHLKYFMQRLYSGARLNDMDQEFYDMICNKYRNEFRCAKKIEEYVKKETNRTLTEDELIYLTVHIRRVTSDTI
ncbi:MAG: PRD domain-containing protein [Lachnospiraceae bacterium]|nr:PRD domain-containing protein [Lachnospiraceae bacterium]